MNNPAWHGNAQVGHLYLISVETDLARVGHGSMYGRLKVGDVLLCLRKSGDSFYDYQLMDVATNGVSGYPLTFGSYQVGHPTKWQPTAEEVEQITKGVFVRTYEIGNELDALRQARSEAHLAALKALADKDIVMYFDISAGRRVPAVVSHNTLAHEDEEQAALTIFLWPHDEPSTRVTLRRDAATRSVSLIK